MLIQFRQGIVQASSNPPFITTSGAPANSVSLVASFTAPVIIDFVQGDSDYLFQETNNISGAWSNLPVTGTCHLYWDLNIKTAVRTFGYTTLTPVINPNAPTNPANGQMWFDTINIVWNSYSYGVWNPVCRVLAGTYSNGSIVLQQTGTQVGIVTPVRAGYVLYDDDNNPVKKYQTFNLGEFITTESPLASQFSKIQNYRLETTIDTATVSGNIPQWHAVCYVAADTIGLATSNVVLPPYGTGTPAIGVAPQALPNGTVQPFLQEGYITDPSFNFGPVGANVFINGSGALTTTPPTGGTLQVMGYVVDSQTLFISPQPAIAFPNAGIANLVSLAVDQTSGNLVAKTLAGTGTVSSIAVASTGTYASALTVSGSPITGTGTIDLALNLFSSTVAGIVPPSGGGTTNFLRADGTWQAVTGSVTSFNTRTGAITLTSADISTALGYTPYNGTTNPNGYLTSAVTALTGGSGISVSAPTGSVTVTNTGVLSFNTRTGAITLTSGDVTTALGFTPYSAANPSGYISTNQTITVTGDISGSGTTALTLTLPTITTAGTYGRVTVNAKGQVTSGSSPTTLAGYGITDGVATDVSTTMNSAVSLTFSGGGTIHGIPTPVLSTDVPNKAYVDAVAQGLSWKAAVKAQTQTNLVGTYIGTPTFTLTASPSAALPAIDGYAANVGDRLLINGQTIAAHNGIYVVTQTTAPWILTRSTDFNEVTPIDEINGAAVYVEQGNTYANTTWTQINVVTTLDTSPINFTQLSGSSSGTVTNVSLATANGISGTVSSPTTTPLITLALGAITPTSVVATGNVTGSNLSGTNTGDQTITLTGDVTAPGSTGTLTTTLATVNSNVGSFGTSTSVAGFTVNAKGLTTAASNIAIAFPVSSVFGRTGGIVATSGDYTFSQIGGSLVVSQLPALTATGDVTGTGTAGTGNIPLTLATVNTNVGSFTNANITVNAKGLVTAASNGTLTATQIAYGSNSNTLTSSSDFTWTEGFTPTLTLGSSLTAEVAIQVAPNDSAPQLQILGSTFVTQGNNGGAIYIAGGNAGFAASGSYGTGGNVSLNGGHGKSGGGSVTLQAGSAPYGPGPAGNVLIVGGTAATGSAGSYISFWTANPDTAVEVMRITQTGALSIGSSGTGYGTSGQVLTSQGNAAPTWTTPSSSASLTTSYVGYGSASNALTGTSDFQFENSDGTSTLTVGDGTTNPNQGIVQGPNGIGIVIKGGHSNGNTTNAALSLTSSSDLSGASGAGSATLTGGSATSAVGGDVNITGGGSSNAVGGNVNIIGGINGATATGGNVVIQSGIGDNFNGYISLSTAGAIPANPEDIQIFASGSGTLALTANNLFTVNIGNTNPAGTAGQFLGSDGSGHVIWTTPAATTPAGSNTQIQFNNSGAFGASSDLEYSVSSGTPLITLGGTSGKGQINFGSTPIFAIYCQPTSSQILDDTGLLLLASNGGMEFNLTQGLKLNSNAGTSGQILTSQGPSSPPIWTTPPGSGTVTSVAVTGANGISVSGSPITTSGTITLSLGAITPTSITTGGLTFSGSNTNAFIYLNSSGSVVDTAAAQNGQLLIGSTGNAPVASTLTAGSGISITNGPGSITIAATGGTVTSVSVTSGTGITASVTNSTTTPNISIQTNGAMGSGGAGVERVVWQYTNGNFTSSTPTSNTSGVAVSGVATSTSTASYAFTGYDHPPVSIMVYGMQTGTPPTWFVQDIGKTGVGLSMADTGTNSAPNLITNFTSSNILTFQMPASASQATGTGVSYLILEFKF